MPDHIKNCEIGINHLDCPACIEYNRSMSEEKSTIIDKMLAHVVSECCEVDREQAYRDLLDDVCGEISVGNLIFSASRIVEELDPIAFRCGVSDMDTSEYYEINGNYYERQAADEARDEFVDELKSEESEIASEIENFGDDEGNFDFELNDLQKDLDKIRKDIETVKNYTF